MDCFPFECRLAVYCHSEKSLGKKLTRLCELYSEEFQRGERRQNNTVYRIALENEEEGDSETEDQIAQMAEFPAGPMPSQGLPFQKNQMAQMADLFHPSTILAVSTDTGDHDQMASEWEWPPVGEGTSPTITFPGRSAKEVSHGH
jgi:hypothetical protein